MCEDGEPDVVGAEDEVVVGAVGFDGAADEAVGGWIECFLFGGEGGLEYTIHLFVVLAGCTPQEAIGRRVAFFVGCRDLCGMLGGVGSYWHFACVLCSVMAGAGAVRQDLSMRIALWTRQ